MKFRRISGALVAVLVTLWATGQDLHEELFAASRKGDVAAVKALLDKGADVNAKWRYDTTALLMASGRGHLEVVQLLIERGANVNVKDTFYGQTPLSSAAQRGSAEVVALLLAKGAEGKDGALLAGVANKNLDLVRTVVASGGLKPETLTEAVTRAGAAKETAIVAVLQAAGAVSAPKAEAVVDPAILQRYAGSYRNEGGMEFVFTFKEGKLQGGPPGQSMVLNAFDNSTFQPGDLYGVKVIFNLENDKVTGLTLDQRGNKQLFKRVEGQ
jgi:ankyrin repeat protein